MPPPPRSQPSPPSLVDRAGLGFFRATSSAGGRFLEVNQALVRMLGYDGPEELTRLDIARDVYLDPADRARLVERLDGVDSAQWLETRWRRRDGTPLIVRVVVDARRDERGDRLFVEGLVEDITDRRRQEELLRRSERMASLGTMLAGVAHELNNPLAAILGFAQLLLKRPFSEEDRGALETISHEASRSATIVKDLLALARQRESDRRAAVHLNDVAGYIVRTRRYALETHGITCDLALDPRLPPVFGDRVQLEQVVLNLLTNAEHALRAADRDGQPGRIAVRTRHEGAHVVLEVEDDGPGVPADLRWRIWDPFWTTKDEGQGTGLGLSVVYGILAAHDATIEVDEAQGGGARFIVRLPAVCGGPARAGGEASADASLAPRPLDVLVVDSEPESLSFLTRFLTSRGHAVLATGEVERALRLTERMRFDAVVCEVGLASDGGSMLVRALRTRPGGDRTRVVLAIGDPSNTRALSLPLPPGVVVTLKPYDVEEMRVLIERE